MVLDTFLGSDTTAVTAALNNRSAIGIELEARYCRHAENRLAGVIAHLEARSISPERAPLPITEMGYLSHFHPIGRIEKNDGTLVEQVVAFLDERAKPKDWLTYIENSRQMSLF